MIVLERRIPDQLLLYEALLKRIGVDDREILLKYQSLKKGYYGELRADREWTDMHMQRTHYLFYSFEAKNQFGHTFQMDTLFMCRHFIVVMESKDIGGRLDFDDTTRQFTQTRKSGEVLSYSNPIDQVLRHQAFVRDELMKIGISLPVVPVVVMTDSSTIIGSKSKEVSVFNITGLRSKLDKLFELYPQVLSKEQLNYVKEHFAACYTRLPIKRNYPPVMLLRGAICTTCRKQMVHVRRCFQCVTCGAKNSRGMYEALHDYRLLYSEWITNSEFREYMGISTVYTASKMLKRMNLPHIGGNKNRRYFIPHDILERGK